MSDLIFIETPRLYIRNFDANKDFDLYRSQQVYDGNFSRSLIDGMGVTAALLSAHGIQIFDETQIDQALDIADIK